jgi:hypothetical protein
MGPFVEAVATVADEILEAPTEIELRITPALTRMEAASSSLEKAARRPLLTANQIKYDVMPALLAAWNLWQVLAIVLLMLLAVIGGYGIRWWQAPAETCQPERGGKICWHWAVQPTEPEAQTPPAELSQQTKPAGRKP